MDDKQQIEIEYTITKESCREAYRYLYDLKVNPKNFIWVGAIMLLYYAYSLYNDGFNKQDYWFYLPLLGLPLGLLITKYYFPRKWGDKMYKQYLGKVIKWVMTKQDIHLSVDNKGKTVQWNYFKKAVLSKGVILMFSTGDIITPIPVASFKNNDFELFKTWLEENVPA